MQEEIQKKLDEVIVLVDKMLVSPDIELDYEIPKDFMPEEESSEVPYIVLNYKVHQTHTHTQKIPIKKIYMKKSPQEIANLITFYIEQFIEQIESVESGAQ